MGHVVHVDLALLDPLFEGLLFHLMGLLGLLNPLLNEELLLLNGLGLAAGRVRLCARVVLGLLCGLLTVSGLGSVGGLCGFLSLLLAVLAGLLILLGVAFVCGGVFVGGIVRAQDDLLGLVHDRTDDAYVFLLLRHDDSTFKFFYLVLCCCSCCCCSCCCSCCCFRDTTTRNHELPKKKKTIRQNLPESFLLDYVAFFTSSRRSQF
mmetsp:Transcript_8213/g.15090  ORF Transcript_8213/g.15090 Transcript_8213/m.15090 type:complete len:206 (-) Transcript_8213:668-1285(-)